MGSHTVWGYRTGAVVTVSVAAAWFTWVMPFSAQSKYESVPTAQCGPGERPETGLQGQTTLAERFSGDSTRAYNCNVELVGQFEGEGAGWDLGKFDVCA